MIIYKFIPLTSIYTQRSCRPTALPYIYIYIYIARISINTHTPFARAVHANIYASTSIWYGRTGNN